MRIFLIVVDSFGIGEMPDADKFGDRGSNTFLNIYKNTNLDLPNFANLGLYSIDGINLKHNKNVKGAYCRLSEKTPAKDTTAGHYEMMGIITKHPNPTYPKGFPENVIKKLERKCCCQFLGNCVASGTEIIKELGAEHIKTQKPILYTSADSVLQIAAHVDIISLDKLYDICEKARKVMSGKHNVGRVIARPFAGEIGKFYRTPDRRDYALLPPKRSVLDILKKKGKDVFGVGKIADIFCNQGITQDFHTKTNKDGMAKVLELAKTNFDGLCFANFVETDSLYGHRNDIEGYAKALMEIDGFIPKLIKFLKKDDVMIITADHGCDPSTKSTDHSREYVPCLIYGNNIKQGVNMGTLEGFDNIGRFVLNLHNIKTDSIISKEILK